MGACRSEPDSETVGELPELCTALAHSLRGHAEVLATPGLDLDLGCNQLADEVLIEVRSGRSGLELFEAIRQLQRVGIEQRELFLHCDREVLPSLESIVGKTDLLRGSESLLVTHLH